MPDDPPVCCGDDSSQPAPEASSLRPRRRQAGHSPLGGIRRSRLATRVGTRAPALSLRRSAAFPIPSPTLHRWWAFGGSARAVSPPSRRISPRSASGVRFDPESGPVVVRPLTAGPPSFASPPHDSDLSPPAAHASQSRTERSEGSRVLPRAIRPVGRFDPIQRQRSRLHSPEGSWSRLREVTNDAAATPFLVSACRSVFLARFHPRVSPVSLSEPAGPTLPPYLHGCDCCSRFRARTVVCRTRSTSPERSCLACRSAVQSTLLPSVDPEIVRLRPGPRFRLRVRRPSGFHEDAPQTLARLQGFEPHRNPCIQSPGVTPSIGADPLLGFSPP